MSSWLLFPAMIQWTASSFLWGLPLTLLPLLLHLLRRRRYHRMKWAATRVLEVALKRTRFRTRFRQWWKVLLRTLIVFLLLIAAAGPRFSSVIPDRLSEDHPVLRIFVVDVSGSMQYEVREGTTRLELAADWIRRVLARSGPEDRALVASMGTHFRWITSGALSARADWDESLDSLQCSGGVLDPEAAVRAVRSYLQGEKGGGKENRAEIYWISDFCRVGWGAEAVSNEPADFSASRETSFSISREPIEGLRRLAREEELVFVDVGQKTYKNHAVLDLDLVSPPAFVHRKSRLTTTVARFEEPASGGASGEVTVSMLVDGRKAGSRVIQLAPREVVTVEFPWEWLRSGNHSVQIITEDDRLAADNRRNLHLPIPEHLSVLLIHPDNEGASQAGAPSAADYLRLALEPEGDEAKGDFLSDHLSTFDRRPLPVQVEPIAFSEWSARNDLAGFDAILLTGVHQWTPSRASVLTEYLRSGGGIILFPGPESAVDSWNEEIFADAPVPRRWSAARMFALKEIPSPEETPSAIRLLNPHRFAHPIVREFFDHPGTGLLNLPVFGYYPLGGFDAASRKSGRSESLAALEPVLSLPGGDPLIVAGEIVQQEETTGAKMAPPGRFVLVTTSLDDRISAMAVWPSFVPLVQQMLRWIVAPRYRGRKITSKGPAASPFDPRESDLAKIDPKALRQMMPEDTATRYVQVAPASKPSGDRDSPEALPDTKPAGREITSELLLLVLALMLLESLPAQWWHIPRRSSFHFSP